MKQLLAAEEMALKLGIPTKSVYLYARKGVIPSVRVGKHLRFEPGEVVATLKANSGDCLPVTRLVTKQTKPDFDALARDAEPSRSLKTVERSFAPSKGANNGC